MFCFPFMSTSGIRRWTPVSYHRGEWSYLIHLQPVLCLYYRFNWFWNLFSLTNVSFSCLSTDILGWIILCSGVHCRVSLISAFQLPLACLLLMMKMIFNYCHSGMQYHSQSRAINRRRRRTLNIVSLAFPLCFTLC